MRETARGMVLNMLHQLESFGFVPNGGRLYYLNRSQPPMLSECVVALMNDAFDLEVLRDALPLLREEYRFWMQTVREPQARRASAYACACSRPRLLLTLFVRMGAPLAGRRRPRGHRPSPLRPRCHPKPLRHF